MIVTVCKWGEKSIFCYLRTVYVFPCVCRAVTLVCMGAAGNILVTLGKIC